MLLCHDMTMGEKKLEGWESRLTKSVALIYCNKFATDRRPSFLLFVASARSVSLMQIAQNAPETMITDFLMFCVL